MAASALSLILTQALVLNAFAIIALLAASFGAPVTLPGGKVARRMSTRPTSGCVVAVTVVTRCERRA